MELVKMSRKGQLVVPQDLRKLLGFNEEDLFIAHGAKDYVVFKKVQLPSLKQEFEELVNRTAKIAEQKGFAEGMVVEEVQKYRKEKRRRK